MTRAKPTLHGKMENETPKEVETPGRSWFTFRNSSQTTLLPEMRSIGALFKRRVVEPVREKEEHSHRHELVSLPPLPQKDKRHAMVLSLLSGQTHLKKYKVHELLGDGAFGFVVSAFDAKGQTVAIKLIEKSKVRKESWVTSPILGLIPMEVHILSSLKHPNIIKFVEYIPGEEFVFLVTELFGTEWRHDNPLLNFQRNPGLRSSSKSESLHPSSVPSIRKSSVDLFECIDAHHRIPLETCRYIFSQIAVAVYYLDKKGVVHRDLKDENVVVDGDYRVKLIDFGSASIIAKDPNKVFMKFKGTSQYGAPEIVGKKAYRGPPSDVWSLGVLLYTMIYGENPFATKSEILLGKVVWPWDLEHSVKSLIEGMLTLDPDLRMSIDQVINHTWIQVKTQELFVEHEAWKRSL